MSLFLWINKHLGQARRSPTAKPMLHVFLQYAGFLLVTTFFALNIIPSIFGHLTENKDRGWHAWDSQYYMRAKEKGYGYEKNHAFMPLMPMFMEYLPSHWISYTLSRILLNLLNLFLLTRLAKAFTKSTRYDRFILKSYIFQPGLVYLLSGYSESLYLTFTLVGLIILERPLTEFALLSASIWFSLATITRTNGLLNLIFIFYALIQRLFEREKPRSCCSVWGTVFLGFLCYFIVVIPLYYVTSVLPYEMYCLGRLKRGETDLSPWCYQHFPSLYGWIQAQYWDVGLFENFWHRPLSDKFTSVPMYVFSLYIVIKYIQLCAAHFFSLGILNRDSRSWIFRLVYLYKKEEQDLVDVKEGKEPKFLDNYTISSSVALFGNQRLLPYILHFLITMLTSFCIGNFEINNRLATGCPMFYLALAQCQLQLQLAPQSQPLFLFLVKFSFLVTCVANLNLMPTNLAFL